MSTVITDNLTGKTSAGDVTITSEGGSATMQLQQGLTKNWVHFDASSTLSIEDSFNTSSVDDNGTGYFDVNFSSSFGNGNYTVSGSAGTLATTTTPTSIRPAATFATGSITFNVLYATASSNGTADYHQTSIKVAGDLA